MNLDGEMSFNATLPARHVEVNLLSSPCEDHLSLFLRIHFAVTWSLFSCLILQMVIVFSIIARIIWIITHRHLLDSPSYIERRFRRRNETLLEHHLAHLDSLVIDEVKLTLSYVTASLLWEFIRGNSIQWICLARWLIEASGILTMILAAVLESYLFLLREVLAADFLSNMSLMVYISKFILWMIMRYIELYSSSTIRKFLIVPSFHLCHTSFHH